MKVNGRKAGESYTLIRTDSYLAPSAKARLKEDVSATFLTERFIGAISRRVRRPETDASTEITVLLSQVSTRMANITV